ncbi:SDR family NAD(P)-dependent oxidoreductase [Candidatus Peregrinibacteria bacterium]|nr:SDR family NAD(P)-dependent oxidoreductase [Candidatus Peregrinibacteria bacterium]
MKILVTGAAGFIGSHSARALLALGHSVYGIDNFNDYYEVALKEKNAEGINIFRVDICDEVAVEKIFAEVKPDVLLHLAARAGVRASIADPELYHRVNVLGTNILLEACRRHSVNRIVFASSSSVYGNQKKIPFSESDSTENPISPYAATKRAAENLCYSYSKTYGLKITCLRFFTVYGPSGRPDMAPLMFTKAIDAGETIKRFGDGSSMRDYTFIDDIVSGILSAVDHPFDFEIINLGNNKPEELRVLISTIEKNLGKTAKIEELPMQAGDVEMTYADITKAQKLLGYQPKTSLDEGIAKLIKWYI